MKIAIGCDNAAVSLKRILNDFLATQKDIQIVDLGVDSEDDLELYPNVAERVALEVASGNCERGIILCGTGLGMAITANKVPGVRAATCHDVYSAERARKSNNAQIITMGARVIGPEKAKTVLKAWLESEFAGGRSAPKVQRIVEIEQKYLSIEK
ncbi:MAG: RpiB/LacA/LacB family sugar-phosphate isomerase [Gammaproteobacteria bacterium]|nr:RpiB/LacA/LacB family sugar-phosphate isomerase [Gammaproteobacteria bacterium]